MLLNSRDDECKSLRQIFLSFNILMASSELNIITLTICVLWNSSCAIHVDVHITIKIFLLSWSEKSCKTFLEEITFEILDFQNFLQSLIDIEDLVMSMKQFIIGDLTLKPNVTKEKILNNCQDKSNLNVLNLILKLLFIWIIWSL
ncbi:hypothetical protein RFI_37244 [Reticulomyxa filosa]|uniref:Uncharacterized protein n=1 Tax=Reticulomyxa filosa TaxID=46433 RepID=X6LF53_RETFI|nr:hypothetical protein RFI_37244 [Reticulomyxa filosa]|eukprot:ETO00204.1 hypothetical protein RFI_37244 [Reticulomyxa filosa]